MALDDQALEIAETDGLPHRSSLTALIAVVPRQGSVESTAFEIKESFTPGPREWAELCRDVVAFANTGGGVIIFGISSTGQRKGLGASLTSTLDPARITDQLRRKAPSASISTAYIELSHYRKVYGVLVVRPLVVPLLFDAEWGYNDNTDTHRLLVRPGVLYVRTPGRSAPARQADLREIWQRSLDAATRRTLARIERVAALPPEADLIVRSGESDGDAFVLTSGGEGRPVRIVDDPNAPAVRIQEVLSPETPYASVSAELAGQVRQWQQADPAHRVSKQALLRWWLQRQDLDLDDASAGFCVLSAAERHGYPMYWASRMSRNALLQLLSDQLTAGSAVPCMTYPYVVGTFFWSQREEILQPHREHLSAAPNRVIDKVLLSPSYEAFVSSVRWNTRLRLGNDLIPMEDLLADRTRANEIFTLLVQRDLDGTATSSELSFAKQLDMVVNRIAAPN